MKRNLNLIVLLMGLFFIVSCGNSSDKKENSSTDTTVTEQQTTNADIPEGARYGMESGIIVFETSTMGFTQTVTLYFEDYGKTSASEMEGSAMGQNIHNINILKDGFIYNVDLVNKTAFRSKMSEQSNESINFMNMDENMKKKFKIKQVGNETIAGKPCIVYEFEVPDAGMTSKTWVWNGIGLKSESSVMGMTVTMEVKSIKENVDVPASKFEVPAGIKIEDMPEGGDI